MLDKTNSQMLFDKIKSFIEQYPEYSDVDGIPATEDIIQEMEEKLNIRFPYEYRLFLEHWGELWFRGSYYTYYGVREWKKNDKNKIMQDVVDDTLACWEHGLPHSYIVFATDEGEEYLCMDTSEENPSIQRWDFFEEYFVVTIAGSFFEQICNDINEHSIPNILKNYKVSIPKIEIEHLKKPPVPNTQPNTYELHRAAENGDFEVVKNLVEQGADVNENNKSDRTPLFGAAKSGNLEVVKYLLEQGANVNAIDKNGEFPLFYAAQSGNLEVVEYLVKNRAHVKAKNNKDITPLFYAAKNGDLEIIKYLVEQGANVNAKDNLNGEISHFNAACSGGHLEVVKYFVAQGLDVNVKSKYYKTPLFNAVNSGNLATVKYLIEQGADINAKDYKNETPLHHAVKNGNLKVIKYLLEHGADINIKNHENKTPADVTNKETIKKILQDTIEKSEQE
ncbi:MAG: ankyrin repeat domain-containing protein [Planctomycetaceae bacterium]|jgi:ankyrin repeat protein|nr:ankyrin repeat domain-containing protein [Planctomycetaceae bacterium]